MLTTNLSYCIPELCLLHSLKLLYNGMQRDAILHFYHIIPKYMRDKECTIHALSPMYMGTKQCSCVCVCVCVRACVSMSVSVCVKRD